MGLDLKDDCLYVPMQTSVNKFLRFAWKGKLYEWLVLPFGLKCSPRILTFMVKPILCFLHGRGISSMSFMDDFTNQARCRCKGIFWDPCDSPGVHVLWLVNKFGDNSLDPIRTLIHLGFLWDTMEGTIALPEDKTTRVENWAKKLSAKGSTTQEELECFVCTLISTTPAVWKAPLH